jgi:hypothetical protein
MVAPAEYVTGHWPYERVDGLSHWMQLDAPHRANELLLDFLPTPPYKTAPGDHLRRNASVSAIRSRSPALDEHAEAQAQSPAPRRWEHRRAWVSTNPAAMGGSADRMATSASFSSVASVCPRLARAPARAMRWFPTGSPPGQRAVLTRSGARRRLDGQLGPSRGATGRGDCPAGARVSSETARRPRARSW